MKNLNNRPFWLTLCVTLILIGMYHLPTGNIGEKRLRRIDILADLRPDVPEEEDTLAIDTLFKAPLPKPEFADTCKTGLTCIEDYADSTRRGMSLFYEALASHDTLPRPVRIAYFGDSFIEGDILTSDFRALMQEHFGGKGAGFIDITSQTYGFRPTVGHAFSGWESHQYTDSIGFERAKQGINQRYFIPSGNAYVELSGKPDYLTHLDTCGVATLYCLQTDTTATITTLVNRKETRRHTIKPSAAVQGISVGGDIGRIRWTFSPSPQTRCYGVAMDDPTGISVDNFSLRGSGGLSLQSIPMQHLQQFNAVRPYNLVILQYGLNVATQRGKSYDGYLRGMTNVINHLKECFPQAGILVIGVGDRAYKDDQGQLRTMPGVKNLIRYQQRIAAENHVAFWNLYTAMGGEGSMPRLVEAEPQMANHDYTHINFKGGRHLAQILYDTMVYGFEQYKKRKIYESAE